MAEAPKLVITADGSHSLISPIYGESYHSKHGALQESLHVFISAGLDYYYSNKSPQQIRILEIGFGSGLNALLSSLWARKKSCRLVYIGTELHPLSAVLANKLNYPNLLEIDSSDFMQLHLSKWENWNEIHKHFALLKQNIDFKDIRLDSKVDIVYYDAFAPLAQEDLWTQDRMMHMYELLSDGGMLVTYCAKGSFKRALKSSGFEVQSIPGPVGKREMTRAIKH